MTIARFNVTLSDGRVASVVPADAAGARFVQIVDVDPISILFRYREISEPQYAAAKEHEAAWNASGFVPEGRSRFEAPMFGGPSEPADRIDDREMAAWRRWRDGQRCVPAYARSQVAAVVAYGERPTNITYLREGLSALSRFYRT